MDASSVECQTLFNAHCLKGAMDAARAADANVPQRAALFDIVDIESPEELGRYWGRYLVMRLMPKPE